MAQFISDNLTFLACLANKVPFEGTYARKMHPSLERDYFFLNADDSYTDVPFRYLEDQRYTRLYAGLAAAAGGGGTEEHTAALLRRA